MLVAVALLVLGPLSGITAAYMNFSLGFFVAGQLLAGILGSAVTYWYGPEGKHGANYMQTAAASVASLAAMCVLVQIETREALKNLRHILAVEGVDGVFIGPADLSADMGFAGNPQHPEVQAAIEKAIAQIRAAGKAPGILMANEPLAKRYLELGALFVAVGVDTTLLARSAEALAARFIDIPVTSVNNNKSVY
jgi:2-keto-3-deoxy-L-rhamnonate aldolase RhmA